MDEGNAIALIKIWLKHAETENTLILIEKPNKANEKVKMQM